MRIGCGVDIENCNYCRFVAQRRQKKRKRRTFVSWIYEMNQNIHYCTKEETLLGEMQQKQEMCTYAAQLEMYVHINIRVIKIQCTQTK